MEMSKPKDRSEAGTVIFTEYEEKLRTALLESGLPYSEVERRCGVSVPAISRFVNRNRGLSSENFCKLLGVLGLDVVIMTKDGRYLAITCKHALAGRSLGRITQAEEQRVAATLTHVYTDPPNSAKKGKTKEGKTKEGKKIKGGSD
jgi:transcriptional regulator with XRE-family HTH domain